MAERKKHQKDKKGFKSQSNAFLNQVPILGGKGVIYTTPESNGNFYFRTWISKEKRYVRRELSTKDVDVALKMGENEMLSILTKINQGYKIFGVTFGEMCESFLRHTQERVNTEALQPIEVVHNIFGISNLRFSKYCESVKRLKLLK